MKVYAVLARWHDSAYEYEDGEGILMEVFANEQDAKKYKADADVDGAHGEYFISPRDLRTGWRSRNARR